MNIHQHKSEQVAFGSRHLRQVCDFMMSALVIVTCVFAGTYSVCILVCFNCYKYGLLQSDIQYVETVLESGCIHACSIYPSLWQFTYMKYTDYIILIFFLLILTLQYHVTNVTQILYTVESAIKNQKSVRGKRPHCLPFSPDYVWVRARYSRLSFRCVLWYRNSITGIGKLRRSGSCHY